MVEQNHYYLSGEINDESVQEPIDWILRKDEQAGNDRAKFLSLIINSPGGRPHAAMALVDIMKASEIDVRTIGIGRVMSAATLIFASGEAETRLLTPTTSFMTHQLRVSVGGATPKGLENYCHNAEVGAGHIADVYFECCHGRMTKDEICEKLLTDENSYFTATQVMEELGLADDVDKDYRKYMNQDESHAAA